MIDGMPPMPASASTRVETSRVDLERQLSGANPQEAADKMEALFATMLVKELRRALPDGFFGSGIGAETFEGWLDEHLGQSLADSGALDLAGQVKVGLERKAAADEAALAGQKPTADRTEESS